MIAPGLVAALAWGGISGIRPATQHRLRQLGFAGLGLGALAVFAFAVLPVGDDATGLIAGNIRLYAWMIFDTEHLEFFVFQNLVWFSVYLGLLLLPVAVFTGRAPRRRTPLAIGALAAVAMGGRLRHDAASDALHAGHHQRDLRRLGIPWRTRAARVQPIPSFGGSSRGWG